jgi:uncharacterized protein (TIRG00374 family)
VTPTPTIRSRFRQGLALCVALVVVVYGGFAIYEGGAAVGGQLVSFAWEWLPVLLALSLANYVVRFIRWEVYLRMLDIRISLRTSVAIFLAGLAMTITPGKIGEFLKSYLLKESEGVPMARSAPIVFVERVTDLLSLLLLASFGVATYEPDAIPLVVMAALVSVAAIVVLQSERGTSLVLGLVARFPLGARIAPKLEEAVESSRSLLGFRALSIGLLLATLAWFFECAEYSLAFKGFGLELPMGAAVFGYSFSTVAGVISPGGVGPTDFFLIEIAQRLGNVDGDVATAASFLVRLCTLWFAVLLGAIALLRFGKQLDVDVAEVRPGDPQREPA